MDMCEWSPPPRALSLVRSLARSRALSRSLSLFLSRSRARSLSAAAAALSSSSGTQQLMDELNRPAAHAAQVEQEGGGCTEAPQAQHGVGPHSRAAAAAAAQL